MSRITQADLEKYLFGCADILRNYVEASSYRDYIFPLLFFKRISDVYDEDIENAKKEYGDAWVDFKEDEIHDFSIPDGCHWKDLRAVTDNVGSAIQKEFQGIESLNTDKLGGVFGNANWSNKTELPDRMLKDLFLMGAGALVSNCDDLQKWYECLKQRKLLSAKAYKRYFSENMNHYCYGLERHDRNGVTMYAHGGDANGIAAYTQYFFDDDLCIIILSNNESLNQYRLGEGIAEILYGKEPKHAERPEEAPITEEELRKFTGTYLPGKIHIEVKNGKLYLVRVNQNIHIELYCIGPNTFIRRHEEQSYTHNLLPEGSEKPAVWGYELVSKELL